MYCPTTSQLSTMSQQPSQKPSTVSSYANVTSTTCFPKKDQAIILDAIDGVTLKDYLISLSSILPTTAIRFVSRISNARICIYLDTKNTADNIIGKKITIQNICLEIKPLISRNKRIVLSNVCPVVPNYIIEQKFQELNIKIMSPISFMKIGVTDPGFSHILSFRRQLYVTPEDELRLPESFQISFEDTNYWIYVSNDSLKCFSCHKVGHLAKNCSQTINNSETIRDVQHTVTEIEDSLDVIPEPSQNVQSNPEFSEPLQITSKGKKRIHSPSVTSDSSKTNFIKSHVRDSDSDLIETDDSSSNFSQEDAIKSTSNKTKKKLIKIDTRTEEEIWNDIKENIDDLNSDNTFPINLDQFISLLDNSKGKQNIKDLVYSYTDNIKDLITMCNKLHCKMSKSLKNRCSRLCKKLHELLNYTIVSTEKNN